MEGVKPLLKPAHCIGSAFGKIAYPGSSCYHRKANQPSKPVRHIHGFVYQTGGVVNKDYAYKFEHHKNRYSCDVLRGVNKVQSVIIEAASP